MNAPIERHSDNYFSELARYYDVTHQWRDYDRQAAFLMDTIKEYRPDSRLVLDLGCGTGEHARRLSDAGFAVTAVDDSSEMLAIAASKTHESSARPEWILSDFLCIEKSEPFDIAYCLGMTVHYTYSVDELILFFSKVRDMLCPAGIFVLDVINPWQMLEWASVEHHYCSKVSQHVHIVGRSEIDRSSRIRHNDYTWFVQDAEPAWRQYELFENLKIWFIDEIEHLLVEAGFMLITKCSDYAMTRLDLGKDYNVAFVARQGL